MPTSLALIRTALRFRFRFLEICSAGSALYRVWFYFRFYLKSTRCKFGSTQRGNRTNPSAMPARLRSRSPARASRCGDVLDDYPPPHPAGCLSSSCFCIERMAQVYRHRNVATARSSSHCCRSQPFKATMNIVYAGRYTRCQSARRAMVRKCSLCQLVWARTRYPPCDYLEPDTSIGSSGVSSSLKLTDAFRVLDYLHHFSSDSHGRGGSP